MNNSQSEMGGQMKPGGEPSEFSRANLVEDLGIAAPSGDLSIDLDNNKKVLLERGITIKHAQAEPDMGKGVVQFIASTEGVKRDGNRVRNDGWSFDNFAKNPQFLWCHDYSSLPIGKHVDWKVDKVDGEPVLRLWSQFCSEDLYPFADKVRKMYEEGFLRAGSIGWIPLKYETIVDKNGYAVGYDFLENDLLEFSAVPVPSDPNALIEAVQRGVLSSEDMERLVANRKSKDNLNLSYRLTNQEHSAGAVSDKEVTIVNVEEDIIDPIVAEGVEQRASGNKIGRGCEADLSEEVEVSGKVESELRGDARAEVSAPEETIEAAEARDEIETEESRPHAPEHVETEEDKEGEEGEEGEEDEEDEERGGMDDGDSVKEKLVYVLQEASKDFTTKIVSAVMEVVALDEDGGRSGEACGEDETGAAEDCSAEEERSSEDAPAEKTDAELLLDQLVSADAPYVHSAEEEAETRIGAKMSRENKDRLGRCRDVLKDVVTEIDKLMEERDSVEKIDDEPMDGEAPEADEAKMSVSEDSVEAGLDWARAADMAALIKKNLGLVEPEKTPGISSESVHGRAQDILAALGGKPSSKVEKHEVKSDYLKELVRRVKSHK